MAVKNCNQCCVFGQEEKKAAVWLSVFRFRDAFSDVSSNGGCDGEFQVPPTKQRRNEQRLRLTTNRWTDADESREAERHATKISVQKRKGFDTTLARERERERERV